MVYDQGVMDDGGIEPGGSGAGGGGQVAQVAHGLQGLSVALQELLVSADRRVFPSEPALEWFVALAEESPEELVPYELLEPLRLPSEALYGDDLEQFFPHPLDAKEKTPAAHVVDYSQVMRAVSRSWPPSRRPVSSPGLSALSVLLPLAREHVTKAELFRHLGSSDVRVYPTTELKSWAQQLGLSARVVGLLEDNPGRSVFELTQMADAQDGIAGVLTLLLGVQALRVDRPDS
jgi:hypothetical protein